MKYMMIFLLLISIVSCNELEQQAIKHDIVDAPINTNIVHKQGQTIATRFAPPKGYTRQDVSTNTYTAFLRNIELKPHGTLVQLYNGAEKYNKVADAVLRFDVGKTDLQQCADAVMRIRSEYLFSQKQYDAIHFNFTNGFHAEYNRWKNGERISVKGNTCSWIKKAKPDSSHETFRNYLDVVYSYAGSLSLSKELQFVDDIKSIEAGDVFIIGGSPGHAVTVMDIAVNKAGEKVFLLSQSYMPAQDIHVLKNLNDLNISPWYKVEDINDVIETPEYTFEPNNLMRFKD